MSQLQTKVLALYTMMTARDVVPVPEDSFKTHIRECLMLFFIDHGRQQFVSRNEDEWVTYRRAEALVPEILAKAATMRDDKARYSPGVQDAFDDLKRYVWEVLSLNEVGLMSETEQPKMPAQEAQSMGVGLGVIGLPTEPQVLSMEAGRAQCAKYLYQVDQHDNHRLPFWRHDVFFKFQYDCVHWHGRLREDMKTEAGLLEWKKWMLYATDTFKKRIRENLNPGEAPKTGDVDVAVATMEFAIANCLATVEQMLQMFPSNVGVAATAGPSHLPMTPTHLDVPVMLSRMSQLLSRIQDL